MNSYELSRSWFDFCFENPDRIRPIHSAMYFFAIEHCNRLGWKEKFGFPSQMVMEAIGVKNWKTYAKALDDLVSWGVIKLIQKSKNQYSSNIISIQIAYVKNTKAPTKALDKALQKHSTKQSQSTVSINKQVTSNKEQVTYRKFKHLSISILEFNKLSDKHGKEKVDDILDDIENFRNNKKYTSLYLTANKWLKREENNVSANIISANG